MDKFHIYSPLGSPSSSTYRARARHTISFCAITRLPKSTLPTTSHAVSLMHRFSHVNILGFIDWYETANNLWLILEYCPAGSLRKIMDVDVRFPESSVKLFGVDLVGGLGYLHGHSTVYNNLNPRNILLDEFGVLKLSKFNRALKTPEGKVEVDHCGEYTAPELWREETCVPSYSSDVWALGCLLYELYYGEGEDIRHYM